MFDFDCFEKDSLSKISCACFYKIFQVKRKLLKGGNRIFPFGFPLFALFLICSCFFMRNLTVMQWSVVDYGNEISMLPDTSDSSQIFFCFF